MYQHHRLTFAGGCQTRGPAPPPSLADSEWAMQLGAGVCSTVVVWCRHSSVAETVIGGTVHYYQLRCTSELNRLGVSQES